MKVHFPVIVGLISKCNRGIHCLDRMIHGFTFTPVPMKLVPITTEAMSLMASLSSMTAQGCGIAMPDSPDLYIEPAGQVDFHG